MLLEFLVVQPLGVREKGDLEDSNRYKHMMSSFIEAKYIITWFFTREGIWYDLFIELSSFSKLYCDWETKDATGPPYCSHPQTNFRRIPSYIITLDEVLKSYVVSLVWKPYS